MSQETKEEKCFWEGGFYGIKYGGGRDRNDSLAAMSSGEEEKERKQRQKI